MRAENELALDRAKLEHQLAELAMAALLPCNAASRAVSIGNVLRFSVSFLTPFACKLPASTMACNPSGRNRSPLTHSRPPKGLGMNYCSTQGSLS